MNMNRFAALAALLTFTGLASWSPSISAAYNTADAVDINVTGLIYADPCTVTVPDTISLGQYARADIAVAGGNTATIPFTIKMTNCPATTTKAAISFNGVPYPDPNYASAIYANSAANPAQDLGLQLFNPTVKVWLIWPITSLTRWISTVIPMKPICLSPQGCIPRMEKSRQGISRPL